MLGVIERAAEIARAGLVSNISQLRNQLSQEGFLAVDAHLQGLATRQKLTDMMREARGLPVLSRRSLVPVRKVSTHHY